MEFDILRDLDEVFEKIIENAGLKEKIEQVKAEREIILDE